MLEDEAEAAALGAGARPDASAALRLLPRPSGSPPPCADASSSFTSSETCVSRNDVTQWRECTFAESETRSGNLGSVKGAVQLRDER